MSFQVPLNKLLFPDPVPDGMNLYLIGELVDFYRDDPHNDTEPIIVRHEEWDIYSITDGRHRSVASMAAGRRTVLAQLEEVQG